MMKIYGLLLSLLLMLLLAACGFHLQARAQLPVEMAHTKLVIQAPYSEFARRLESYLEQNGVEVVTAFPGAAVVEVPVNLMSKEIQSIGDRARVREFLIRHTVKFRLLDGKGNEMIPLQTFEQSRVYSFNKQDILAAERESEFLTNDLSDSLARMVVRRLGTFGK